METLDLSDVFARMKGVKKTEKKFAAKANQLKKAASWKGVPAKAVDTLTRLGVVLDDCIKEYGMDALAIRCWVEMQQQLNVSPCILLGLLNDRRIATACEVDVGNAITMHALRLASGNPATCLDWNNNYADEADKCILFHCGPVPPSLMQGKGRITDHAILANAVGAGCSFGCNVGRIKPCDFTYGSMITEDGDLCFYVGQGRFTGDPIPADFFGCAGVAEIRCLQDTLQTIGYLGHRHHTSVTPGRVAEPVCDTFERYLGYEVTML